MIVYNPASIEYIRDGQPIPPDEIQDFAQASLDASGTATDLMAQLVADGTMIARLLRSVAQQVTRQRQGTWHAALWDEMRKEHIRQYILGRGGREQMTQADWGSVGGMLSDQERYLRNFAKQVEAGELSEAQIRARSRMYVNSAREALARGSMRAHGIPKLPAYPADGQTKCLTACNCTWRFEPVYDETGALIGWNCYWELNPGESCVDCEANHAKWYPLFVPVS